jgi:hypothetical protein
LPIPAGRQQVKALRRVIYVEVNSQGLFSRPSFLDLSWPHSHFTTD